jgi:hypothetical protein
LELAEEIVNSVSYKVYPDAWPYSDPGRDVDVTLELLVERFPSLEASHEEDLARVRNKSVPVYEEYVVEPSTTAPDSSLYYMSDSTVAYIDEYLKEDENAWRTLFSLVDSFTGKVGELVMVVTSING